MSDFIDIAEFLLLFNKLRQEEGATLMFQCTNPDPDNNKELERVTFSGEVTEWDEVTFSGPTILDCLQQIVKCQEELVEKQKAEMCYQSKDGV